MTDYKTCSKCFQSLPVDAFNRRSDAKDGRQSYCRRCAGMALQERGPKRRLRPHGKPERNLGQ